MRFKQLALIESYGEGPRRSPLRVRPQGVLCTTSSATRSKISSCVFFPSHQTQVASPAEFSSDAIVIVGPVLPFYCTTSPSLNSCMGLLLDVCDEVYRPKYTQAPTERARKELHNSEVSILSTLFIVINLMKKICLKNYFVTSTLCSPVRWSQTGRQCEAPVHLR